LVEDEDLEVDDRLARKWRMCKYFSGIIWPKTELHLWETKAQRRLSSLSNNTYNNGHAVGVEKLTSSGYLLFQDQLGVWGFNHIIKYY